MKRWIAALLTVAMLISCFPLSVLAEGGGPQAAGHSAAAEEAQAQKAAPEMDVETGGMTVEATNSFGKLLLDSMDETNGEVEAGLYDEENKITGLSVEGTNAWVDFCTTADGADLVVAIYTEDELEMLASGTVEVAAGETSVTVALEGTMPDYFMAKAYLLAKEDHAPISPSYCVEKRLQPQKEIESVTIDDFNPECVLNLDEDPTTNFVVFKPGIVDVRVEETTGMVEQDDEKLVYTIVDANEEVRSLQPGDILSYEYAPGELMLVKVEDIVLEGNSVTLYVSHVVWK